MKTLLPLLLLVLPLPVRSQMWVEYYKVTLKDGNGRLYEHSKEIDVHSIRKTSEHHYFFQKWLKNGKDTDTYTIKVGCKEQTIQRVVGRDGRKGEGWVYKRFPNGVWNVYFPIPGWEQVPTGDKDLLLNEICGLS